VVFSIRTIIVSQRKMVQIEKVNSYHAFGRESWNFIAALRNPRSHDFPNIHDITEEVFWDGYLRDVALLYN